MIDISAFILERIAAFENEHGLLEEEARDCLAALLSGCININPVDLGILMEKSEEINAGGKAGVPCCFCKRGD